MAGNPGDLATGGYGTARSGVAATPRDVASAVSRGESMAASRVGGRQNDNSPSRSVNTVGLADTPIQYSFGNVMNRPEIGGLPVYGISSLDRTSMLNNPNLSSDAFNALTSYSDDIINSALAQNQFRNYLNSKGYMNVPSMSSYSPTIADNIRGLLSEQQRSDFDSASNLLDKAGSFAGSMVEDPLGLQNLGEIGIDLAYGNDIPNYKYEQLALDAATSLPFTKPFKAAVDAVKPFAKPALAGGTGLLGLTYEPTEADAAFLLGRKGVVNLYDKGIRSIPNNYFRARDLELQGVPADEIERLTGFGKSPLTNDKFAMYIHDQNFGPKRDFDPGYTGTFGADWDTGMLGFAYPDVKNLKFKVTDGRGASYSPEGNIVTFGDTLAYPGGIRQVANHEVGGHYVQGVEGWPGGTNPDFLQQSAEFFKNARTNTGLLKNIVRGIWDPDFGGSAYYASRNQAPRIIQNAQDLDPSGQLINDFVSGRSTKVGPNRVFSEPSYAGYLATPGELASSKLEFLGNQNPFVVDRANIPVTRGYGPKELNLGTNPTAAQIRDLIDWSKTDELYRLGSNEGKIVNDLAEEASWWKNPMFDIKTGK